ncbi:hypothetical protein H5410_008402 [Solanum commersonii]|uniref:Uncharacterized protein n=1 Tax=Solanum commersonii TaxID=4109 RepID=A0A9J6AF25_SOLCO|nr:hypothetical protein H5410_008402 [Solanum commersonii]
MEGVPERVNNSDNKAKESEAIILGVNERGINTIEDQQYMIDNSISGRETWEIEEAIPIATEIENATIEQERINSAWVRQNIIKLGKMFGADFKGHEEEATELLMQIDACRQVRRMEPPTDIQKAKYKEAILEVLESC